MVKNSILSAGIMRCRGRRHIETQTNHASFWDLHYQSKHIRRSETIVKFSYLTLQGLYDIGADQAMRMRLCCSPGTNIDFLLSRHMFTLAWG